MTTIPHRGFPDLIGDLIRELINLMRGEARLAKAEVTQKIIAVGMALGLIAGGLALVMAALVIFLEAAVAALVENGLSATISTLIVGVAVLVIAGILIFIGIRRIKGENLTPTKTLQQLQRDAALAKR
jgi:ribose/xylose/arabinose/galactoside ABC-type transport system permease subunit